jgi:two-component system, NarL family, response regulator YdfI
MIEVGIMAPMQARRDWLEQLLRAERSLHIAGTTTTFSFLRSLVDETVIDVCVIDLVSPPESETERDWLMEFGTIVPVVALTSSSADSWLFNTILHAQGGGALLQQNATSEQIISSIHSSSIGLVTLDSSLVPQPEAPEDLSEELTPRESEVLRLLAEGFGNREIANRLNISEHTIKFHIRSILAKLGAATRTEAVTRGLRAGLIEL